MKVLIISTTTNENKSTSRLLCGLASTVLEELKHEVKFIDANKLHIVKNLSCYANGGKGCADPKAGPYRCWAHFNSEKEPEKYGGKDEMPVIYDGLEWADIVIFATSVRWGSHSALLQTIVERMNTLENRATVYGEKNPLNGKRCGVIVTGQHWQSQEVAARLINMFGLYGFDANPAATLVWQFTSDMNEEQTKNNAPALASDMKKDQYQQIIEFVTNCLPIS